ncbi:hypothetical protein PN36_21765 [Candidatus Thiomargarita nelsonii]|uniref:Uncharacterized protein n=1 Tax=Candidatus Thiomargarita nelsonii TaxID=1003181 RepID=A0A4E0RQT4_9GAMM|nr:hypothetical protein PN36_21765 [Candidatus Thiomargarita nelsonii]
MTLSTIYPPACPPVGNKKTLPTLPSLYHFALRFQISLKTLKAQYLWGLRHLTLRFQIAVKMKSLVDAAGNRT